MSLPVIGMFGGTFDPIHLGHLRSAQELCERLSLQRLLLVPCHLPPHRATPEVSAQHRLAMVAAAVAGFPELECDDIELRREHASYTLDTLQQLRQRYGEQVSLVLVMGGDSFNKLHTWRDWRGLFELAHVVVIERPGYRLEPAPEVAQWVEPRRIEETELAERGAGGWMVLSLEPWPISATEIRAQLASGEDVSQWLPDTVAHYIKQHGLYGGAAH